MTGPHERACTRIHQATEACALWFTIRGADTIQSPTLAESIHVWAFAERTHGH
ncbi:MAG: hypothetical protein IV089_02420 [Thiobacillus sp.]|nr:hypothetical protein [Thiobacillus sp.]